MIEPTEEELIEHFDGIFCSWTDDGLTLNSPCQMCEAIRRRISEGPEVTREWVQIVVRQIIGLFDKETNTDRYLAKLDAAEQGFKERLREAGIHIKGEK